MEFWEDSRYVRHIRRGRGVPRKTLAAALLAGGAVALGVAAWSTQPPSGGLPGAAPPGVQALGGEVPGVPGLLPTHGPLTPGRRLPAPAADPSAPGWTPKTPTPGPVFTVPPPVSMPTMAAQGVPSAPPTVPARRYPAPTLSAYPSSGPPPTPSASPSPTPTPSGSPVPSASPSASPSPQPSPSRSHRRHTRGKKLHKP